VSTRFVGYHMGSDASIASVGICPLDVGVRACRANASQGRKARAATASRRYAARANRPKMRELRRKEYENAREPLYGRTGPMKALMGVETYIEKAGRPATGNLIKTRVSQINGCAYCLHMHTKEALQHGESRQAACSARCLARVELVSARERAALPGRNRGQRSRRHTRRTTSTLRRRISPTGGRHLSVAYSMINAWTDRDWVAWSIRPTA